MLERILVLPPVGYMHGSEGRRFASQLPQEGVLGYPWGGRPNVHEQAGSSLEAGTEYIAFYVEVEGPLDAETRDALRVACEGLVTAYDPTLLTPGERARQEQAEGRSRWAALTALRGKSVAEIYDIVQNRIDGWSSLAEAKADFREWMPLLVAVVAWDIMKDANAEEG
jgi:hypothetical protein